MAEQYDVSLEQRKVLEEKAQRRAVLRNELLKLKSDPFRHASQEGGGVFDAAIQRYTAMTVNQFDYFKPSVKNGIYGMGLLVIPMGLYGWLLYSSRKEIEDKYRRGEVAYKDRNFKFI